MMRKEKAITIKSDEAAADEQWREWAGRETAARILGEVTQDRVALLQETDAIVIEEIRRADLYDQIWQAFAVLLPVSSVGVMGDNRTYENAIAIRAVDSPDGRTADGFYIGALANAKLTCSSRK